LQSLLGSTSNHNTTFLACVNAQARSAFAKLTGQHQQQLQDLDQHDLQNTNQLLPPFLATKISPRNSHHQNSNSSLHARSRAKLITK